MDISGRFLAFTLHGAGWVLWLLIALSVMSMAVMLERLWYFRAHRLGRRDLAAEIRTLLQQGDERGEAGAPMAIEMPTPIEITAPMEMTAAIEGVKTRERLRLERRLPFLATLGSNGPFVGLFGTVLGIIKAFHDLAATQGTAGAGASTVMAGISEALVATAIGLLVAIPAVVAFNYFSRRVRVRMAEVDWLAHLAAEDVQAGWARSDEQPLRRSA
ncbi:MAG TPA: MotA/TolQ/ExbB proton channel family protein [Polyangia bacterium]|jgi:biopolymer transport protein ExbB|nr:MotA/TolQ/ExbB proton channel family protein [Polyangia bacterium]